MPSVVQSWVHDLPFMQQSVLLTAIRAPDGVAKYHASKPLIRWYRRCILLSAMDNRVIDNPFDRGGGSFTGPSADLAKNSERLGDYTAKWRDWEEAMEDKIQDYIRAQDEMPHHFQMHFLHAIQIVGYKHPDDRIREWWLQLYVRLVNTLHLYPEGEEHMDKRLGDNRANWLARNDAATTE